MNVTKGGKGDLNFRISDVVKPLIELIFNPCGEFQLNPEDSVSHIHSPHLHMVPLGSLQIF